MELLSVMKARSIWLFDLLDLNPRGKSVGIDLVRWLAESYKFVKVPTSPMDLDENKALAFLGGRFNVREEAIHVDLKIHWDGLVADTLSSTDDSDLFLKEALESAVHKFGLKMPDPIRRVIYLSELNVRCEKNLSFLNPKLVDFSAQISSLLGAQLKSPFELVGMAFWHDPLIPSGVSQFRIERKINTSFSENRYYSVAPLKTSDHIAMLNVLENLMLGEADRDEAKEGLRRVRFREDK